MSVFYYDPFYDVERMINDTLGRVGAYIDNHRGQSQRQNGDANNQVQHPIRPRMDLHEDLEANTVTATLELPGVKKEDVQIDVHNGRLSISAETKLSEDHEQDGYAIRERRFGKISRTLQLPQGVKETEVKAAMDNGLLTITFPKSTPEQAAKKVTIA
ncbi:Small heat shock protein [Mycena sanguinolenta]|uniref:Small heat shock protein n=1 Tax=Mycena sanguinolenta TaxID=230812 RepID=A0A8H7D295_9AGAR|nr:Small heat shock protein [Mycena sanguinolenta]